MSVLDDLRPAVFNNVPFFIEGQSGDFGHRVDVHEYPFRDDAWIDDLGQLLQRLTIRGFILDNNGDLRTQHENIIAAINKGAGPLDHPRLGKFTAQPGRCRWSISDSNPSKIDLFLVFLPPEAEAKPEPKVETQEKVEDTAGMCLGGAAEDFADEFAEETSLFDDVLDTAGFVLDEAKAVVNGVLDVVRGINGQINAALAPIAEISQAIDNIGGELAELILQPLTLFNELQGVIASVLSIGDDVENAINGYRSVDGVTSTLTHYKTLTAIGNDESPIPETTPSRIRQANNKRALQKAVATIATVEAVRAVAKASKKLDVSSNADSPFDSYDAAIETRDELMAQLEVLSDQASPEMYDQLSQLRVDWAAHIDAHGMRLPRIERKEYSQTLPALVVAHMIYGDAAFADDLITRNNISHPLFIKAGTGLEVLK